MWRPRYMRTAYRLSRKKPRMIARACGIFLSFFYSLLSGEAAREVDPYKVTTKAGDRLHPAVIVVVDGAFSLSLSLDCVRVCIVWKLCACATARNNVILNVAYKGVWPAHDVIYSIPRCYKVIARRSLYVDVRKCVIIVKCIKPSISYL